jgi:hypothetical protein
MSSEDNYGAIADALVSFDPQLARATVAAIRAWARRQRTTVRTFNAMLYAVELEAALERSAPARGRRRRPKATGRTAA